MTPRGVLVIVSSQKSNDPPLGRLLVFVTSSVPEFTNDSGGPTGFEIVKFEPLSAMIVPSLTPLVVEKELTSDIKRCGAV